MAIGLDLLGKLAKGFDLRAKGKEIATAFKKQVESEFDEMAEEIIAGQTDEQIADSWRNSISKNVEKGEFVISNNNPKAIVAEFGAGAHKAPNGVVRATLANHRFSNDKFGKKLRGILGK